MIVSTIKREIQQVWANKKLAVVLISLFIFISQFVGKWCWAQHQGCSASELMKHIQRYRHIRSLATPIVLLKILNLDIRPSTS